MCEVRGSRRESDESVSPDRTIALDVDCGPLAGDKSVISLIRVHQSARRQRYHRQQTTVRWVPSGIAAILCVQQQQQHIYPSPAAAIELLHPFRSESICARILSPCPGARLSFLLGMPLIEESCLGAAGEMMELEGMG
jgi:hypothetical protein